jgi:hypothetical protein
MKPSAMKHRPGRRPNISNPRIRASDRKSPSPVEEVGSGHPTTKSHTDSSASKQKERLRWPHQKDGASPPSDSNGKRPYLSEDVGGKRLRDEEEAGKPYSATTTTSSPRRRRPDTHIAEDHPPARPSSTTNDGKQTLAPPPDLDDEQTQELGPNPTIYTSARWFADLPSSTMPWLPPEGRKAGEIAAGNAIRPLLAFCNCSRGEEAKSYFV